GWAARDAATSSRRGVLGVVRLVGREIELDARAVRIVKEHLPRARPRLAPARVLDAARRQHGKRVRQVGGRKRHVVDHAGPELVGRAPADDMEYRTAARIEPRAGKLKRRTRPVGETEELPIKAH